MSLALHLLRVCYLLLKVAKIGLLGVAILKEQFTCGFGHYDNECYRWFLAGETWMNVQFAAICISIFLCALAIVWTCTSFCPCCCRRHPLVMVLFSGLITVLLAVSVALYVIKHGKYVDDMVAEGKWMQGSKVGFIAQCVALALAVISKITSILHYKVHRQQQN